MDIFTKEKRSEVMRAVKSSGTKIEVALAKALWKSGVRYRKNNPKVFGKPDLTLRGKVAVFVDGEFWHGKDWEQRKGRIKSNAEFWTRKIERNMQRDSEVNSRLSGEGWTVLRFWGRQVEKDLDGCVRAVVEAMGRK